MNSAYCEANEIKSPPFLCRALDGHVKRAKVIHASVRERWFFKRKSFSGEICHYGARSLSSSFSANYTSCDYCPQSGTQLDYSEPLLHQSSQVVNALVPKANFSQELNGQSDVLRNSGPFNQQLSKSAFADNPRVPASAGLSAVWTWYHSSVFVNSKICDIVFATKSGCFSRECTTGARSCYQFT